MTSRFIQAEAEVAYDKHVALLLTCHYPCLSLNRRFYESLSVHRGLS